MLSPIDRTLGSEHWGWKSGRHGAGGRLAAVRMCTVRQLKSLWGTFPETKLFTMLFHSPTLPYFFLKWWEMRRLTSQPPIYHWIGRNWMLFCVPAQGTKMPLQYHVSLMLTLSPASFLPSVEQEPINPDFILASEIAWLFIPMTSFLEGFCYICLACSTRRTGYFLGPPVTGSVEATRLPWRKMGLSQ